MFNLNDLLNSKLTRDIDLTRKYIFLSELSDEEREMYVENENDALQNLEQQKIGLLIQRAKRVLLRYKYAAIAFRTDGIEFSCTNPLSNISHYCRELETLYKSTERYRDIDLNDPVLRKLSEFRYSPPSELEYIKLIEPILEKRRFTEQLEFLTNNQFSLRLPDKENLSLNEWAENNGITEKFWRYQYEEKISKWDAQWFKSRSDLNKIHEDWRKRRVEVENFLLFINDFFPLVYAAKHLMETLDKKSRELRFSVSNLNKANIAIREGTKLKHLLLEEGVSHMQLMKILNDNLGNF